MKPWSQLPNASHIDWLLETLKTNPDSWRAAYGATLDAARDTAYDVARDMACHAIRNTARDAIWNTARNAVWNAARNAVWNAARDSILALVAYDDCQQYLSMSYEQLKVYAILSERPQAILLLSLKRVQEQQSVAA